jgi:hypothetical protein
VSKPCRSREACGGARQHHGCCPCRSPRRLTRAVLAGALAIFLIPPQGGFAQTLLNIRILEGEGAIHGAGSKDTRPIVIQITDEIGQPVPGAAVSFRMPEEGPSGTFARGMKTDIATTTADGRAATYGATWNAEPGPLQVRVTAIKGQSRAGTVVSQFISSGPAPKEVKAGGSSRKRWLVIAGIGAGAVAAGVLLGSSKAVSGTQPQSIPAPQVGVPTITIGRPQ